MNPPTLIDLPFDIVREIALIVDAADTIALRQVHRLFHELPIKLTKAIPGLDRVNINTIMKYPNIYSFTGFVETAWFFDLRLTHPGYNNIRQLEINRCAEDCDPLPLALEELSIINHVACKYRATHFDLAPLKRLRVVKCVDECAILISLPDTIVDLEVDIMNIVGWELPKSLIRLKITNYTETELDMEDIDFPALTELRELEVFGALREDELPPSLLKFSCSKFVTSTGELSSMKDIHVVSMCRPDRSIPWDPSVHLVNFVAEPITTGDLTEFVNLETLDIYTLDYMEYMLPPNIINLTVRISVIPDLTQLRNLRSLHLHYVSILSIDDIPTTVTYLKIDRPSNTLNLMDFTNHGELSTLYISLIPSPRGREPLGFRPINGFQTACVVSNNLKLEDISFKNIKVVGELPLSLVSASMVYCDLGSSIDRLERLKSLSIYKSNLIDDRVPPNIDDMRLVENFYPESCLGTRLSHLLLLKILSVTSIILTEPLPPSIIDLSIFAPRQDLDLSHLSRLETLSIKDFAGIPDLEPREIPVTIIGPLPQSLRTLNLEETRHCFDLHSLPELETLNIVGWGNNIEGMGTFPASIKYLVTDKDFDITKHFLPNLVEHVISSVYRPEEDDGLDEADDARDERWDDEDYEDDRGGRWDDDDYDFVIRVFEANEVEANEVRRGRRWYGEDEDEEGEEEGDGGSSDEE